MADSTFAAATLDPYAELITTGLALVGGVLLLPELFWFLSGIAVQQQIAAGVLISAAVAVALLVFLVLNYAVQPTAYEIEAGQLVIRRRWARRIRIPFSRIVGVSVAGALADLPRRGLRRAFNAGVFGYHGPFRLDPYGIVFFSATNREKLVAVARHEQMPLIISPTHPRDFVEVLRQAIAGHTQDANAVERLHVAR